MGKSQEVYGEEKAGDNRGLQEGMICRAIDRKYNQRLGICRDCGELHWYNIKPFKVDAYNIKYKMVKDHQREKYHKELLQPIDKHGRRNEEFYKIYGDPKDQKNPNS